MRVVNASWSSFIDVFGMRARDVEGARRIMVPDGRFYAMKGWKISGGSFTMESTCEPSPLGPLKR